MNLNTYISLFPGATREKPRFMALAQAVLAQAADLGMMGTTLFVPPTLVIHLVGVVSV